MRRSAIADEKVELRQRLNRLVAEVVDAWGDHQPEAVAALVHVAGHNLGILMRLRIGAGTPKETAARSRDYLLFLYTEQAMALILVAASPDGFAILAMAVLADPG